MWTCYVTAEKLLRPKDKTKCCQIIKCVLLYRY